MDMYATSATLQVGVTQVRPVLPELLDFITQTGFDAERVTTVVADWDDAPLPTRNAPPSSFCTDRHSTSSSTK
ncbi:hypothetical protein NOU13_32205 [Rhodococcus erythropolis]|uniref:hypothetical protein n=1 Tax=Rhodococcus erythropolis TaxID=1833 RepID=UPI00210C7E51|nr:hypothetical protein [Rhodococcus erythropolis]MCQ4129170.1 hypothetical protein [Rhodococcus erythropolis]